MGYIGVSDTGGNMVIEVIPNNEVWWENIRTLRNDERVKGGFIHQENITPEAHKDYMTLFGSKYMVALVDGRFAGYVGSIGGDIRVCVDPQFQGKGVGVHLIEAIMGRFPNSYAKVKIENEPSKRLFDKCGFKVKYVIMEKDNGSTQSL